MKIKINKQLLIEEITTQELNAVNKKRKIPLFKKDIFDLKPRSNTFNMMKDIGGVNSFGPGTVPNDNHLNQLKNLINLSQNVNPYSEHVQTPGVYIKGQTLPRLRDSNYDIKSTPDSNFGANVLARAHENDEYSLFNPKKRMPYTNAGQMFGHHSLANVLGRERNIIVTGDKPLREAGQILNNKRISQGELDELRRFLPRNQNGLDMIPDFASGPRLNRRHLRAIYSKELGLGSGASRKDIYEANKSRRQMYNDIANQFNTPENREKLAELDNNYSKQFL